MIFIKQVERDATGPVMTKYMCLIININIKMMQELKSKKGICSQE